MTATQEAPVRIGLVGAGPWATMVHAPVFAAGPETSLVGVWARRPDAAAVLAERFATAACATPEELFERCEAVVFAVPPDVQAELGVQAAASGCALVLEKPIAGDLAAAERLADAIDAAGVPSVVVLTWRFTTPVRAFLDQAGARTDWSGGRGEFLSGGLLAGSPFATPWRLDRGPLLDVGPHVLDLLDAALGPITEVTASGQRHDLVTLHCLHDGAAVSQAALCSTVPAGAGRYGVELYGPSGILAVDCASAVGPDAFATLRREVADLTHGRASAHPLDVRRGLHLQRLLATADAQLR